MCQKHTGDAGYDSDLSPDDSCDSLPGESRYTPDASYLVAAGELSCSSYDMNVEDLMELHEVLV